MSYKYPSKEKWFLYVVPLFHESGEVKTVVDAITDTVRNEDNPMAMGDASLLMACFESACYSAEIQGFHVHDGKESLLLMMPSEDGMKASFVLYDEEGRCGVISTIRLQWLEGLDERKDRAIKAAQAAWEKDPIF